jgi:gliding motility-associated-like protein
LLPKYFGIKGLSFFNVYNRWGELVFTTKNMSQGWDGTINGRQQPVGTFIWIIKAVDYDGKIYELKGTTTVVR